MPKWPSLSSREIEKMIKSLVLSLPIKKEVINIGQDYQWQKRRVTLLANQKDFCQDIMKSIIRQSGLTEEEFYQ